MHQILNCIDVYTVTRDKYILLMFYGPGLISTKSLHLLIGYYMLYICY